MPDAFLDELRATAEQTKRFQDILAYRAALKNTGTGRAELDLTLPHRWGVIGSDTNRSFTECRKLLIDLCARDNGLHPFFGAFARPLTFKENVQARIHQWRTTEGRDLSLWKTRLDSCTAVAAAPGGQSFKITTMSPELMNLDITGRAFLPVDFNAFIGVHLPINETYDKFLTLDEAIKHKGWLAALEGDKKLLKEYATLVFVLNGDTPAMRFSLEYHKIESRLRALSLDPLKYCSADGIKQLNVARLLRMCPLV